MSAWNAGVLMILLHAFFCPIKTHNSIFPFSVQAGNLESANKCFSPSKIKQWAVDDLAQTMSWLDSQEEKVGVPNGKKNMYLCSRLFV